MFICLQKYKYWVVNIPILLICFGNTECFPQCYTSAIEVSDSLYIADSLRYETPIEIIFTGDIMVHESQLNSAYNDLTQTYDFSNCFQFIKHELRSADYSIGNLETTLSGKPYKGYPRFTSPDELSESLSNAGFDFLTTCNNHSVDGGGEGIKRTIETLENSGIRHTGTFLNYFDKQNSYPAIIDIKGYKVALLNYTFSTNQLQEPEPYLVNRIERSAIREDLKKVKQSSPDFTIVFFHWGSEYKTAPNNSQRKLAKFCFEEGADFIVGAHPHVMQSVEQIEYHRNGKSRNGVVVYSLGNFISSHKTKNTNGGGILKLKLQRNRLDKTYISQINLNPIWVFEGTVNAEDNFYVLPLNGNLNQFSFLSSNDHQRIQTFVSSYNSIINQKLKFDKFTFNPAYVTKEPLLASLSVEQEISLSEATMIPVLHEESSLTTSDTTYRLQFMASRSKKGVDLNKYPYLKDYNISFEDNWNKYLIGNSSSLTEIRQLGKEIRQKGHPDAFIAIYVHDKRVGIKLK